LVPNWHPTLETSHIADVPDNATAAALSLVTSASGAVHTRMIVPLTPEEMDAAAGKSPTYRAAGSECG
jgi:uncharacterized protein with GYD domain